MRRTRTRTRTGHLKFEIRLPKGKGKRIRELAKQSGVGDELTIQSRWDFSLLKMRREKTQKLPLVLDFFQKVAAVIKGSKQDRQLVVIQYSMGTIASVKDVSTETVLFWEGDAWSFTPYIGGVAKLTDPRHLGLDVKAQLVQLGVGGTNRRPSFGIKGVIQGNTK